MDAIRKLCQDHDRVRRLFEQAERAPDGNTRVLVLAEIRSELETHATIEENLFYPACEKISDLRPFLQEAYIDHQHIRILVNEVSSSRISSRQVETRLKLLREIVELHLHDEEMDIFPIVLLTMPPQELEALGNDMEYARLELVPGRAHPSI